MKGSDIVTKVQIGRMVNRIARTLETELDCGEFAQYLPSYVEAILAGQAGLDRWALVRQHFEQCEACWEELMALRNVAKMDLEGTWLAPAALLDLAARRELTA